MLEDDLEKAEERSDTFHSEKDDATTNLEEVRRENAILRRQTDILEGTLTVFIWTKHGLWCLI